MVRRHPKDSIPLLPSGKPLVSVSVAFIGLNLFFRLLTLSTFLFGLRSQSTPSLTSKGSPRGDFFQFNSLSGDFCCFTF